MESQTKEIGGDVYTMMLFPAMQGFKLLNRLKKTFGGAAGALIGQQIESIIALIGADLSDDQMLALVMDLLELTSADSKDKDRPSGNLKNGDVFNGHFAGRYGRMLKVLAFVLEVNYSDFLTELIPPQIAALGKDLVKEMLDQKLQSSSLNESDHTGQSIESGSEVTET